MKPSEGMGFIGHMAILNLLWNLGMLGMFVVCSFQCAKRIDRQPVETPVLWIAGLILSLAYMVWKLSRFDLCERYTLKQFEANWIKDRSRQKGFHYHDKPGCYAILIYRFPHVLPFAAGYSNVYVGQSLEVYQRIHNHLNRKGNGDVYADVRDGRHIEIEVYPCKPSRLNAMEKKLIRRYHAEAYYNRTAGGGTRRGILKH